MPPGLQEELDTGKFDPRNILRGYDGELYDGDGNFLAEVNTWQSQINVTNSEYQAAGNKLAWAVMQSYTVTLTFTETVIGDASLLRKNSCRHTKRSYGCSAELHGCTARA